MCPSSEDNQGDNEEDCGRLGPYRLLRKLGSGGTGTVYRARREDGQYQQQVAVKILRAGLEDTEAGDRFRTERQILARLEHPNIARLYDGGSTEEGRPFLVMELVEGLPVDVYCDRHHLGIDRRLDLFRRICGAVQYAHQNLLVHRDLKPGNILVTADGDPKLLDFSIAKQLAPGRGETGEATEAGLWRTTPSYASPEQVRGEAVTTASDVYSLGVLLYELLAGRSPYQLAAGPLYEIESALCDQEPERPSEALFRREAPPAEEIARARGTRPPALRRRLRGDLDNITRMALRKEPGRRYGSVARLASDVASHLLDQPVTARREDPAYLLRKFVRRHRAGVSAAVLALLLVLGFVVSLITQGREVARERDKARYALSFLVDTFKDAGPYHTRGEQLTAREILDKGADRAARELAGQPDVQASLMDAIGEVDVGLGRYDQAEPLLERALELRRLRFGPRSLEVADSLERLAAVRAERSDLAGAERLQRQALALKRRLLGARSIEVAKTLNAVGTTLSREGTSSEIERLLREAQSIALAAEGPEGPTVTESTLNLARMLQSRGDYAAAEALYRKGLDVERKVLSDRDPRLYSEEADFAVVLDDEGKFKESEALLRRCLAVQRQILPGDHPDIASTLNNLAMAVHHQGRFAEAEALDRRVLAMARSQYGPSHWRVAFVLGNLAAALDAQNRAAEAIPYLEEALAIRRRTLGERHPLVAQALLLLAGARRGLGEYPESLAQARQALAILEESEGPEHPHVAYALREIGGNYSAQARYPEAEPYLRRSLAIRRKELPPEHPELAKAKTSLSDCLIHLGRYDEAEILLREAEATLARQFSPSDERVAFARTLLAQMERRRGLSPPRRVPER